MPCGLEPLHAPLPLAGGLVRVLGTVVEVSMLTVLDTRQNVALCRAVAPELIRDNHPGDILTAFEELAEEFLGRMLIPPPLYENVQHMAVLIHRTPQIVVLLIDRDQYLIQVPLITGSRTPAS